MYRAGPSLFTGGNGGQRSGQTDDTDPALEMEMQTLDFFKHATSSFDPEHTLPIDPRNIKPEWKRRLHELMEHPNSSQNAFIIHISITLLIFLSAVITVCETIPAFHSTSPSVWFGLETSFVVLFTVEYIARALAWSLNFKLFVGWAFSFFGIVDLLAILPYYIELVIGVDTSVMFRFSILRTFRLLRVFRSFRSNNTITLTIEVMILSVKRSQHALLALGFFLLMFLVIFSTILYFAERGSWDPIIGTFIDAEGEPSQFSSIPAAAWFVLVTITTVGYGEITPRSFLGRLLTVPLLVCGLLLIALPSFVLGREFSALWDRMGGNEHDLPSAEDIRERRLASESPTPTALAQQITDLQGAIDAQGTLIKRLMSLLDSRPNPLGSPTPSPDPTSISKHLYPNGKTVLWDAPSDSGSEMEKDVTSRDPRARKEGKGKRKAGVLPLS